MHKTLGELREDALEAVEADPSDAEAWELLERVTVKLMVELGFGSYDRAPVLPDRLQRIWKALNGNCRTSFEDNCEMGAMIAESDAEVERRKE